MTLAELRQEVIDRGYDYIKPARITEFLQRAHREICSRRMWPFLETSKTGVAPLDFTDLGDIITVQNTTRGLLMRGTTRRWLTNYFSDLTERGTPVSWYLEDFTVRTYPEGGDTILVHYMKRPATLIDEDEPLIPSEWQYLMVDRAVVDCLKDDDEYEDARALRRNVQEGIAEMAPDLLHRNRQDAKRIIQTGRPSDYIG